MKANETSSSGQPFRQPRKRSNWLEVNKTNYAKEKLIRILRGEDLIPKQDWGVSRILATLIHHRDDKRLRASYRQFKTFSYQIMMEESASTGKWPGAPARKDWDSIIILRAQAELERRYNREVRGLCKTPCFGAAKEVSPAWLIKALSTTLLR